MKVYVYPLAGDGIDNIPTQPSPVELVSVGHHIERWLARFRQQGYYFNANMQRVPVDSLRFRLEISGPFAKSEAPPELTPAEQEAWDKWHSLDQR